MTLRVMENLPGQAMLNHRRADSSGDGRRGKREGKTVIQGGAERGSGVEWPDAASFSRPAASQVGRPEDRTYSIVTT